MERWRTDTTYLTVGVLEKEEDNPEEEDGQVQDGCDDGEEATLPETDAEESDSYTGAPVVGGSGGLGGKFGRR